MSETMLNENEITRAIHDRLKEILNRTNILKIKNSKRNKTGGENRYSDISLDVITPDGKTYSLTAEIKSNGQPRFVRMAVAQLKSYIISNKKMYGIIGTQYLSEDSRKICRDAGFGYIDVAGNCLLAFDDIFIEIEGKPNPYPSTRPLKSIFSPKTSRALRVLMNHPQKNWYVKELAQEAQLSLGQVSNLKKRLLDNEWIATTDEIKFRLTRPDNLLSNWTDHYQYNINEMKSFYIMQSHANAEQILVEYFQKENIRYAFTLTSGAARVAPFLRYQKVYCYADDDFDKIASDLRMKEVPSGANTVLLKPFDEGIYYHSQNVDGANIVCDVQLYLDLYHFKERGSEAAEFILNERIKRTW